MEPASGNIILRRKPFHSPSSLARLSNRLVHIFKIFLWPGRHSSVGIASIKSPSLVRLYHGFERDTSSIFLSLITPRHKLVGKNL